MPNTEPIHAEHTLDLAAPCRATPQAHTPSTTFPIIIEMVLLYSSKYNNVIRIYGIECKQRAAPRRMGASVLAHLYNTI